MALAKKGSRRITVGGSDYRWLVSPQDIEGIGLVVEHAEEPAQRIVTWFEHGDIISPSVVAWTIKFALAHGWNPKATGSEMHFCHHGQIDGQFSRLARR